MDNRHVESLRPTLTEWERGNFAAGADVLSPDVVLHSFVSDGFVVSKGWEEIGSHLRDVFGQWRDYRIEAERLTALDDSTVLMEGRQYGLGKRSEIRIEDSLHIVFRFTGDRVTEMYWHPRREEVLDAAGVQWKKG
jgi:ketosteroid isomerase-like protein